MLRLLPHADVSVIERCSGHGGSWGVLKGNFETAIKVGRPVARQALKNAKPFLSSECPLAGMHIVQEMEMLADGAPAPLAASDRAGRPRLRHSGRMVARKREYDEGHTGKQQAPLTRDEFIPPADYAAIRRERRRRSAR